MGAAIKAPAGKSNAGEVALNLLTGGLAGVVRRGVAAAQGKDIGKQAGAGFLSLLTGGASEVKTGGGVYGDETVADSLFPKQLNDYAQGDRSDARAAVDAKAAADKAQLEAEKPGPPPDFTDETLAAARKSARLRASMAYGRAATFGTKRNTLLGG